MPGGATQNRFVQNEQRDDGGRPRRCGEGGVVGEPQVAGEHHHRNSHVITPDRTGRRC
jgi:hypothetical protein